MPYDEELNLLEKFADIPEINTCLELETTDKFRGELLRTVDKLLKYHPKTWSIFRSFYSSLPCIFSSTQAPNHFNQLNANQYYAIEIALFSILNQY